MGKIYSILTRPIRTFNIANRAERVISRKPILAPQYPSVERQKILVDTVNPNFMKDHYKKNAQLDQRLKDVFVTSTDQQDETSSKEAKPLPQVRYIDEFYNFYDPKVIPEGKCSLRQALTFILQHKQDPIVYSSGKIAVEYKMDKKVVDDILKHFKTYMRKVPNYSEQIEVDPFQNMFDTGVASYKKEQIAKKEKNAQQKKE